MSEIVFATGNEAVGWGAIYAGCKYFFGYPITPQNEIPEFMSRELPKIGGCYVQSEAENISIAMVYGGAMAGARVMTSTSSPGIGLMQADMSHISASEVPAVIVDVMRGGPGMGTTQESQNDYRQAISGGHGGYRCIVLAPWSPQETFDLMQLAFYLADKYRMISFVLSDYIIGEMAEVMELRKLDFGPLPEKDWALTGKAHRKSGKRNWIASGINPYVEWFKRQTEKYQKVTDNEVRCETYEDRDAELLLTAYGSTARAAWAAVDTARAQGLKVGLFRPITLWPFPKEQLQEAACRIGKVLAVEDSQGQFVDDVRVAVEGQVPVHFLGNWARHRPLAEGLIFPDRILEEVKKLL